MVTLELKRELLRVSDTEGNCESRRYTRTLFFHEDGVSRLFQAYPIDGYAEGAPLCLIVGELVTAEAFEEALDPLGLTIDSILENAVRRCPPSSEWFRRRSASRP